jgi:hypothetical protein
MARPRKLVYWVAPTLTDRPAYNLRGRRRKDVVAAVEKMGGSLEYGRIEKVEVLYWDVFDLLDQALGEGGVNEPGY